MALVFRPPTGRQNCHHLFQLVNTILSELDCSINIYQFITAVNLDN